MSKFSEKCKALLQENGTNVYRLSNNSSLERTALQRMVTGKRLPGIEFVKQFCQELRMPLAEERHLIELYKMEVLGEDVYRNRQCIHNLIRYLFRLEKSGYHELSLPESYEVIFEKIHSGGVTDYEYLIYSTLEKCFQCERSVSIYTNYSAADPYFFRQLQILNRRYPDNKVNVEHRVHFQINMALTSQNLQILYNVLPLTLSGTMDYTSYYYYSRVTDEELCQFFLPYYIITPTCFLGISGDLQNVITHTKEEKIREYLVEYKRLGCHVKPLFQYINTLEEAWEHYAKQIPENVRQLHVIGAQPCYRDLITDQDFRERVELYHPEFSHFVDSIVENHNFYKNKEMNLFFSEEGLDYFCETGKLTGQIGALLPELSIEERIVALESFLHHNPLHHYYLFTPDIQIPYYLNFEIYEDRQFQLIQITEELKVSIFTITESSICDAFWDYTSSLPESEYVRTEKKTEKIVLEKLRRLELMK